MGVSRHKAAVVSLQVVLVFAVSWVVLAQFVNKTPEVDEFFHVLSARSVVADGTLRFGEGGGLYTRARAYTYAVAACFKLFGESWESGRLPSLISGALLVAALFGWLYRAAGWRAAWIGAVLLLFAPDMIGASSMVRFYMPNALFVWLTMVCVYVLVAEQLSRRGRLMIGGLGLISLLLAAHMQMLTVIAAVAVAVWGWTEYLGWLLRRDPQKHRKTVAWLIAGVVGGVIAVWSVMILSGAQAHLIERFQAPRMWSMAHRYEFVYYHRFFGNSYPLLWAGFPFAAVIAMASRRRAAWFCLVVFLFLFAVHSLLPVKAARYMTYAWPCFFAVWALALDALLIWMHAQANSVIGQAFSERFASRRWVSLGMWVFLLCAMLFAMWTTPAYKLGRQMLAGESLGLYAHQDWDAAKPVLRPIAEKTGFVVSSSAGKSLYYLGRNDVTLNVSQAGGREDFQKNPISNRPVITTAESVQRLMSEHPQGLIVIEADNFGARWFVPTETALYIEENTQRIELDENTGILAFRWGGSKVISGR